VLDHPEGQGEFLAAAKLTTKGITKGVRDTSPRSRPGPAPGFVLLASEEIFDADVGLLEDGAQGAFGHVAGMVGDGGVAVAGGVEPDSWLPAACRSKAKPSALSLRTMSR